MNFRKRISFAACVAALTAVTGFAGADVLVTKDGSRIETKGPWKVEGNRIFFTTPNGTYSAIRAQEVDLEASRSATTRANAAPAPAPAKKVEREPVLVLTNKDIPEVIDPGGGSGGSNSAVSPSEREPVQVIDWKKVDTEEGGVEIRGSLRNTGPTMAANINLRIEVKDEEETVIGTAEAFLASGSLLSGRSTTFRAVLDDVPDFAGEPVFQISSTGVTLGESNFGPGAQADTEDEADDGDEVDDGTAVGEDGFEDEDIDPNAGRDAGTGGDLGEESGSSAGESSSVMGYEDRLEEDVEVDRDG